MMGLFEHWPYVNFHDLNLDWIIKEIPKIYTSRDEAQASAEASAESAAASQLSAEASQASADASQLSAEASQQSAEASQASADASAGSASDASDLLEDTRAQISLLQSRVDNIIPDGTQTEGNTELLDIRVSYDGYTYDSAGNSVRGQIGDVYIPFYTEGVSTLNRVATRGFKDLKYYTDDINADVELMRVAVVYGNPAVTAVVLKVNGNTYNILNRRSDSYTPVAYNEFDIGIANGYFIIDWDVFHNGNNYINIGAKLKQENIFPKFQKALYENVDILIPSEINVSVGHEVSIEYYNAVKCSDINEFQIYVSPVSSQVQNLHDRLRINPTTTGSTNITMMLYKNSVLIKQKTFKINFVSNTQPSIKAIFLGDSMTAQGFYLAELKRMLGTNITLYGTRSSTAEDSAGNSQTVQNEGRSGWSTANYINDASYGGVSNPFYNNGFDFSYYMENNPSFNDVTDVFILLGTNDGAGTNIESRYQTICDSIKNYSAAIRIHCMLPIPPIRSGYAFGIRNNQDYEVFKDYMFSTGKKFMQLYENVAGYSIIPTNLNINCYYDFPQTDVPVNSRNPQMIPVGNDNVHPAKYGYYRFSDVIYADIIKNCQ